MEQCGVVSDRRELNRQIRADNKLLRELKAAVQTLTDKIKNSVKNIAARLETLRGRLIMIQYQLNFNTGRAKELKAANTLIDQLLKRYRSIVKDIKSKTAERKSLQSEKRSLSPVHIIRHNKLSNCISELTEDIEELKNQKNIVLREMYCENDKHVTNIEQLRSKNSDMLSQIDKRNVDLTEQKKNTAEEFEEVRNGIPAEDVNAIQEERLAARDEVMSDIRSSLQKMYGRKYSYDEIRAAEDAVSKTINREMILLKKSLHEILRQNHQKITGSARTKKMDIEL